MVVTSEPFAEGLRWATTLPPPVGLGLPADKVTAITPRSIAQLAPDHDCVVHHVFDPHEIFSELVAIGPRAVTFILLKNELRFIGERFQRVRELLPEHPAHRTILAPIHERLQRLPLPQTLAAPEPQAAFSTGGYFE